MKLPDNYRPRKGDEILLRARVKFDAETNEDIHVAIVGATWATVSVPQTDIVAFCGRTWEQGDKIVIATNRSGFTGKTGIIEAISDENIWIKLDDGRFTTERGGDLSPIDEPKIEVGPAVPEPVTPKKPF